MIFYNTGGYGNLPGQNLASFNPSPPLSYGFTGGVYVTYDDIACFSGIQWKNRSTGSYGILSSTSMLEYYSYYKNNRVNFQQIPISTFTTVTSTGGMCSYTNPIPNTNGTYYSIAHIYAGGERTAPASRIFYRLTLNSDFTLNTYNQCSGLSILAEVLQPGYPGVIDPYGVDSYVGPNMIKIGSYYYIGLRRGYYNDSGYGLFRSTDCLSWSAVSTATDTTVPFEDTRIFWYNQNRCVFPSRKIYSSPAVYSMGQINSTAFTLSFLQHPTASNNLILTCLSPGNTLYSIQSTGVIWQSTLTSPNSFTQIPGTIPNFSSSNVWLLFYQGNFYTYRAVGPTIDTMVSTNTVGSTCFFNPQRYDENKLF